MDSIICKNCNHHFKGNYCNQCGQAAATHEMNLHFIWHDVQHGLLHMDKGILFTIKEMFTRPGYAIKDFITGKRIRHFRPISFVLVLAGICGFLYHYFHINILADKVQFDGQGAEVEALRLSLTQANEWMTSHYALVALLLVPIFSIGTYIAFHKAGYNYIEHIVLNAYLSGPRLILLIVFFPIYIYWNNTPFLKSVSNLLDFTWVFIIFWAFMQFFKPMNKWTIFWRTIFALIIAAVISSSILLTGIFVGSKI